MIKAELVDSERFTQREAEIAVLMAEGKPNKLIATALAISIKTVDVHVGSIYEKLGIRSRSINTRCTAILLMVARGMVSLSVKSLVTVLIFNAVQLDDEALRLRGGRLRSYHVGRIKRDA